MNRIAIPVFFLVIFITAQAVSLQYDCSHSHMPVVASGMSDLQEHNAVQYCLIDNCTIMWIDSGQQLDVAYTTQNHLVVTPTNGQTFLLIHKNEHEQFCLHRNSSRVIMTLPLGMILLTITAIVSGYTTTVILIFKELRSTFGKLMMLYSMACTFHCINILALLITTFIVTVHSTMLCYIFWLLFLQFEMLTEEFSMCISAYLAYIMHSSYKCIQLTKESKKKLYKYSIMYAFGLLLLFDIVIITYDFGTNTFQHAISTDGYCSFVPETRYITSGVLIPNIFFNKALEIIFLIFYFIYYRKLNKLLKMIRNMRSTDGQQNPLYLKVAIGMGATIGISKFLYIIDVLIIGHSDLLLLLATFCLLTQQTLIMTLIMCSKKMPRLCKEKFCTSETS